MKMRLLLRKAHGICHATNEKEKSSHFCPLSQMVAKNVLGNILSNSQEEDPASLDKTLPTSALHFFCQPQICI